jgi:hypothetical protein
VAVNAENWSTGIWVYKIALINKRLLVVLEFIWSNYGKQLESDGIVVLWDKI